MGSVPWRGCPDRGEAASGARSGLVEEGGVQGRWECDSDQGFCTGRFVFCHVDVLGANSYLLSNHTICPQCAACVGTSSCPKQARSDQSNAAGLFLCFALP